jgi:hypothetical protein
MNARTAHNSRGWSRASKPIDNRKTAHRERKPRATQQQHGTRALDKSLMEEMKHDGSHGHLSFSFVIDLGGSFPASACLRANELNMVTTGSPIRIANELMNVMDSRANPARFS